MLLNQLDVQLLAGGDSGEADGVGGAAKFAGPIRILLDKDENLIVADYDGGRIRKVTPAGEVSTMRSGGWSSDSKTQAVDVSVAGLGMDANLNLYAVGGYNYKVWKISPTGDVTSLAGDGQSGFKEGRGPEARFSQMSALAVKSDGTVMVAEGNGIIRQVTQDGDATVYAGADSVLARGSNGPANQVKFNNVRNMTLDPGGQLFVSMGYWFTRTELKVIDTNGKNVRAWDLHFDGFQDGPIGVAKFGDANQLAFDGEGNTYLADTRNHAIRKVSNTGIVTTLVGDGYDGKLLGSSDRARLRSPQGVAITHDGKTLYIADTENNRILKVKLAH